jgi:RNase P/RNase MRP subunit p29
MMNSLSDAATCEETGEKTAASKAGFYGEIINFTDDYIELKKGSREIILFFDDSTKIFDVNGEEADASGIQLCQMARAYYKKKDGKNILVKLKIADDKGCGK